MARIFVYNGLELEDPDSQASPQEVKYIYAGAYSELVNAEISGPETREDDTIYTFRKVVGTKGTDDATASEEIVDSPTFLAKLLIESREIGWVNYLHLSCRDTSQIQNGYCFAV